MKKIPLEIISLVISIIALLTCSDFYYPSHFGHYGIIDAIAFIFALICLIKKLRNHELKRRMLVYTSLFISIIAIAFTIEANATYAAMGVIIR